MYVYTHCNVSVTFLLSFILCSLNTIRSQHLNPCISEQAPQLAAGSLSGAGSQITFPFTSYEILQRGRAAVNACGASCLLRGTVHGEILCGGCV